MFFRGRRHRALFFKETALHPKAGNRFYSALYLLTADSELWEQTQDQVSMRDIHIQSVHPQRLRPAAYLYFRAARELLTDKKDVGLRDIAVQAQKYPENFKTIMTALRICGGGGWKKNHGSKKKRWE